MAEITIDTTSGSYQQYLTGLDGLRAMLAPRIRMLEQLSRAKQIEWLARDPLLRRTILLAQKLERMLHLELAE